MPTIRTIATLAAAMTLATPLSAAIYIKIPDIDGESGLARGLRVMVR